MLTQTLKITRLEGNLSFEDYSPMYSSANVQSAIRVIPVSMLVLSDEIIVFMFDKNCSFSMNKIVLKTFQLSNWFKRLFVDIATVSQVSQLWRHDFSSDGDKG